MSEYQYYEFQAIDRPLTADQMADLRSCSTRATITPTSFVNVYNWGDLKGDVDRWMEEYFDAFLYLANWGTHVLKLRLPARLIAPAVAAEYCCGDSCFVREHDDRIVISFVSEDEDSYDWVEGEGQLSSLISVRSELLRGDLRALYLGWLLQLQSYELDDEDLEPSVPPGLGRLSASLESLADFLRIDRDLLSVTAAASPPLRETTLAREKVRAWVEALPGGQKDDLVTSLVLDADLAAVAELRFRFRRETAPPITRPSADRRTVGELLAAASKHAEERRRREAQRKAEEKARREREAALAREKHLDGLVGQERRLWAEIARLVATKQPRKYDEAVRLLMDLRDLAARGGGGDFRIRLERFRVEHARKPSLIGRLEKARL